MRPGFGLRFCLCLVSLTAFVAAPAFAQEEDLAPVPVKKDKPRPKAKPAAPKTPRAPVVKKGGEEDLAPPPVARPGELVVKTTLTRATLLIDGKEIGVLPLGPQQVPSGEHTVLVRRPGFANYTKKVNVGSGKTVEVDAKLTAVMAVLTVTSDVAGAQVFLDGKLVGTTPLNDLELPAKPVEVVLKRDGYLDEKRTVTLASGKDFPVAMKLTPVAPAVVATTDRPVDTVLTPTEPTTAPVTTVTTSATPITSRWYFWAGVAAVVAAGVIGTTVALNNQQPRPLTQKDICYGGAKPCDGSIGVSAAVPWSGAGAVHF